MPDARDQGHADALLAIHQRPAPEYNEVVKLRLSADFTRATVVSKRTYPGADVPTGIAVSGNRLLVTNSQFDTFLYHAPLTSPTFTLESLPLE